MLNKTTRVDDTGRVLQEALRWYERELRDVEIQRDALAKEVRSLKERKMPPESRMIGYVILGALVIYGLSFYLLVR